MSKKITNRDARQYVQNFTEFEGSNLFSSTRRLPEETIYAVYSYGTHWPLFIWSEDAQAWFENEERHSVTTSKHRSQSHPHRPTILLSLRLMRKLATEGYKAIVTERILSGLEGTK
jgi:hypothetical protein